VWQPLFWIVVAFAAGLAARHWFSSIRKIPLAIRPSGPRVVEWLTPTQAAERFAPKELLSKDRLANERVNQLRDKVRSLEELLEKSDEDHAAQVRDQLKVSVMERDDAIYVAKRRRTDMIDSLRIALALGLLVGKGQKITMET